MRDWKGWLRLERLFLIAGLLALAVYGGARLYSSLYQQYTEYAFEQQMTGGAPSLKGFFGRLFGREAAPEKSPEQLQAKDQVTGEELLRKMVHAPEIVPYGKGWSSDRLRAYKRATAPKPGSVLGRLEIPSVELSVMLLHGTDNWTLNRAVGHIEGTALPGESGNLGVAGHRDGFFRTLKDLPKNSVITLTTLKGRFHYRVNAIHIVGPREVKLLAPTSTPTITLVTCYPFHYVGDAPKRYVVSAEIFKAESPAELAAYHQSHVQ